VQRYKAAEGETRQQVLEQIRARWNVVREPEEH